MNSDMLILDEEFLNLRVEISDNITDPELKGKFERYNALAFDQISVQYKKYLSLWNDFSEFKQLVLDSKFTDYDQSSVSQPTSPTHSSTSTSSTKNSCSSCNESEADSLDKELCQDCFDDKYESIPDYVREKGLPTINEDNKEEVSDKESVADSKDFENDEVVEIWPYNRSKSFIHYSRKNGRGYFMVSEERLATWQDAQWIRKQTPFEDAERCTLVVECCLPCRICNEHRATGEIGVCDECELIYEEFYEDKNGNLRGVLGFFKGDNYTRKFKGDNYTRKFKGCYSVNFRP